MGNRALQSFKRLLVINKCRRLKGKPVKFVAPLGPTRYRIDVFRLEPIGQPLIDQLDLQIHRRADDHIGFHFRVINIVHDNLIKFAGIELAINDVNVGIFRLKHLDKGLHRRGIGRRPDMHLNTRKGLRAPKHRQNQNCDLRANARKASEKYRHSCPPSTTGNTISTRNPPAGDCPNISSA